MTYHLQASEVTLSAGLCLVGKADYLELVIWLETATVEKSTCRRFGKLLAEVCLPQAVSLAHRETSQTGNKAC
ncbi:hypothetical protein [Planctopirus ephydatiae]|uniref:hypothetical protein n=1 Tax=Planctopirus ephydatiae TaxID=2528019 RepID=UPI0011AB1705|nr:hypothetical protein [Planctopirus ephydatiae]